MEITDVLNIHNKYFVQPFTVSGLMIVDDLNCPIINLSSYIQHVDRHNFDISLHDAIINAQAIGVDICEILNYNLSLRDLSLEIIKDGKYKPPFTFDGCAIIDDNDNTLFDWSNIYRYLNSLGPSCTNKTTTENGVVAACVAQYVTDALNQSLAKENI